MAHYEDAYIKVSGISFSAVAPGAPLAISNATFTLTNINPAVSQAGQLFAVGKRAKLWFYLTDPGYKPQDVWFLQTAGNGDGKGTENMKDPQPDTYNGYPAYTVKNILKPKFIGSKWKILIPVINSTGTTGVIDPEITNTAEDGSPPFIRGGRRKSKTGQAAKTAKKSATRKAAAKKKRR